MTVSTREAGAAFADVVYADQQWVDAEFEALVSASFGGPPAPPRPAPPGSRRAPATRARPPGNPSARQPSSPPRPPGRPALSAGGDEDDDD